MSKMPDLSTTTKGARADSASPRVSVIMPCYNHARYAGASMEAVLGQSYADLELIVVDDCSTDGSVDVIKRYAGSDARIIPVYHYKNTGVSRARNDALAVSRGKLIAFCDADDVWEKGKLREQVDYLDRSGCDAVFCDSIIIDERGTPSGKRFSSVYGKFTKGRFFDRLLIANFINTQTVLVRRSCIDAVGPFDESFRYLEDWIYWLNIAHKHRIDYLDRPLARYRVHGTNTCRDAEGYARSRIAAYKFILGHFPDIPEAVKSSVLYEIGINYQQLGEKEKAQQFYRRSFKTNRYNVKSFVRNMSLGNFLSNYSDNS